MSGTSGRSSPWTETASARLEALWRRGFDAQTISAMLRTEGLIVRSPASVTSRAARLGLPVRNLSDGGAQRHSPRRVQDQRASLSVVTCRNTTPPQHVPELFGIAGRDSALLAAEGCQWIEGEDLSAKCGAPIERGSYCATHGAAAYVKASSKPVRPDTSPYHRLRGRRFGQ